jgi:hypothetical protein
MDILPINSTLEGSFVDIEHAGILSNGKHNDKI